MKLNETIELNGKEYTVELNRESILRIEQYTNLKDAQESLSKPLMSDKSKEDIKDNEDPFAEKIDEDTIEEKSKEKAKTLEKIFTRAFWIWLYPNEKLSYNEVCDILKPYLSEDETKAEYIALKYQEFIEKSVEIRKQHLEEQKNLKALAK